MSKPQSATETCERTGTTEKAESATAEKIARELLRAVQYAEQMAEVLACMSSVSAEGRRARKLGEELHERMQLALSKAVRAE